MGRGGWACVRPIPAAEWQVQGVGWGASRSPSAAAKMHHSNAARPLAACTFSEVDQEMHALGAWRASPSNIGRIHPLPLQPVLVWTALCRLCESGIQGCNNVEQNE